MSRVGVRFKPAQRLCFVDDGGHHLKVGDHVRVELDATPGEVLEAVVAVDHGQLLFSQLSAPQGKVVWVDSGARL